MTYRPQRYPASSSPHATFVSVSLELVQERRMAAGLVMLTVMLAMVTVARPAQAAGVTETDVALASHAVGTAAASVPDASVREVTGQSVTGQSVTGQTVAGQSRVWPWWRWYQAGVSPQFAYRQVVETGRRRGRRAQRFEIRTRYRYVPRRVSRRVADVDVLITGIDVYQRGRFVGSIERIPPRLRRTRARIFRNRPARIDREIAVIGGGGYGYELLALRPGRVWQRPTVLAAARVNIRRGAAIPVRRSTLISSRRSRYLAPIPLLPPDVGQISTRLLRFDVSYYDDSRFGAIYDGPRWSYEGDRYDSHDRFDDRYDSYDDRFDPRGDGRFDDRFKDSRPSRFEPRDRPFEAPYDRRYDRRKGEVNPPRSVPRPSPQNRRTPYRQEASPTTEFAENERLSAKRSAQNPGSRAPAEDVDPRPNARTARNASPTIDSRSDNTTRTRNGRGSERAAERSAGRTSGPDVAMRMARRSGSSSENATRTAGRSASAMRRTPDTVTGRDTRTVGNGDDAVTIKRETEIVRLDDYEE